MTTWGPWEEYAPGSDVEAFQRGFGQGADIVNQRIANRQRQEQIGLEKERLGAEEQQLAVNESINKQKMALATQAAARATQATLDYQNAIKAGMDPGQAAMMYGPAMSGGRMTGFAPIFGAYEKAHTPPPSPIPPNPVKEGDNIVGYSDRYGNVHYKPAPKAPPTAYETTTTTTPGLPGRAGIPAHESASTWWNPFSWGDPSTPAIPPVAATPKTVTSVRRPVTAVTPPAAGNPVTATAPQAAIPISGDQPLTRDQSGMRGGYSSPEEVRSELRAGNINRETATQILQSQFGFE